MINLESTSDRAATVERVRRWTFETALPFWADRGLDPVRGGFVERMELDGRPDLAADKRVRVQARQIYVFSHAATLGWSGGLEAAREGHRFLTRHARLVGGGWARRLTPDGTVTDPTLDLYDQAFVLLALAWFHRASGEAEPMALAHRTFDAIERELGRPDRRGFRPEAGADDGQQNPHMHLLEAVLALHAASGEARWLEAANALGELFRETLFDPDTGTLAESFDHSWRRIEPAALEPGHQFEWVWLLARLDELGGAGHEAQAMALYDFGLRAGVSKTRGLAFDQVDASGAVLLSSSRLWPQTELLKARLARGDLAAATAGAAIMLDRYLDPAPPGGWRDHFDADGRLLDRWMPASSLYHLFVAFSELLRVAGA